MAPGGHDGNIPPDRRRDAHVAEHVVVIGAGVYGAAVAMALARRGALVSVLDAAVPASGTSGATFSWLNSCGKQPRAYHDLNVAGMRAHRALAAAVPDNDWYHETGNLEWVAGDAAALREKVAGLLAYGYQALMLSRAEALALEPDIDPAQLPADDIAYYPSEGWLDPVRLVTHLLAAAAEQGAEVVRDDAVALDLAGGVVRAVRLASGRRIAADAVVNCAGPAAARIAALAGLTLPMGNTRGTLVYTAPTPAAISHVLHAPRIHLRPSGSGRLVLHSEDIDGDPAGDEAVGGPAVRRVLAAARALYPVMGPVTVDSVRVGVRPIPGDGLPVLGRARAVPNFHFAVSHSGATLCLYAGDLVAAEITGEDRSETLAPYRFERFQP
jgi:glycine/D-amino acid oxidase-like deaminating enzyme